MQKFLERILLGVVFLLPFIPLLVFDGLFFPFITGKAFVFRILVEVGVIVLALLALTDKRYIPKITPITAFFGLFVAVMLLADVLGANITRSIWSNFERMEGWITLIHLFGAFILFEKVLGLHGLWKRWMQVSLGVSVLVGIHGVFQVLGIADIHQGGVRLDANFGNATYLAVYSLMHFFFALLLFLKTDARVYKFLYAGVAVLNMALIYFSATRGALLGLVAGMGLFILLYGLFKKRKGVVAAAIGFGFLVLISFGALVSLKGSQVVSGSPVLSRIASISLEAGETRFKIWSIAYKGFLERPIIGWGQGNFNLVFSKYYDPSLYAQEPWFDRAHNVFVDWLVAGGILGLASYVLLFGSALYFIYRGKSSAEEKAIFIALLGAYFVNNLFVFDNLISYILFIFILAHASAGIEKGFSLPKVSLDTNIARSLIIIVGLFVVYAVNVPALNANGALLRALGPQYGVGEKQALFQEALSYKSFADQEIREQMVQLALRALRQENLSVDAKIALLADAVTEIEKQAALMPESARIHLLYGLTHRLLGSNEKAYEILSRAKEIAPQKQSVIFEFALAAEAAGRKEEALLAFKKAYELDTSYEQAQVLYEQAELRLSK
tara:strand:- start:12578 stop:14413 length:1836 start_codon:yes stop_codon:yes gene_type:complete